MNNKSWGLWGFGSEVYGCLLSPIRITELGFAPLLIHLWSILLGQPGCKALHCFPVTPTLIWVSWGLMVFPHSCLKSHIGFSFCMTSSWLLWPAFWRHCGGKGVLSHRPLAVINKNHGLTIVKVAGCKMWTGTAYTEWYNQVTGTEHLLYMH